MRDPAESHAPVASGASPDASPPDAPIQEHPAGERGNAPRRGGSSTTVLLKRLLAGAAITGATELALGRRLYFAWESLRRAVKWLEESGAPKHAGAEQQPTARPPSFATPQEAMEEVVQEVLDWSQRTVERHKPTLERASKRMRERLKEPRIGAAVIGGAALGVVASVGILPAAIGAGTAYIVHRKLSAKNRATPLPPAAPRPT